MRIKVVVPKWSPEQGSVLHTMAEMAKGGEEEVILFLHDDVDVLDEDWEYQVEKVVRWSRVGMFGFGGAYGLGTEELYKRPYQLQQLARLEYVSNMKDAEAHGKRVEKVVEVAVLDGFALGFTREAYERMGGWEDAIKGGMPPFHMYDAWAACRMKEMGLKTFMVPVRCHHHGGRTSTSEQYQEWLRKEGWKDDVKVHQAAHMVIYDRFRRVLPIKVRRGDGFEIVGG